MRLLLLIILMSCTASAFAQSVIPLRADRVRIYKQGGFADLYLENVTKDSTKGLAVNIGGGLIRFLKPRKVDNDLILGLDTFSVSGTSGPYHSVQQKYSSVFSLVDMSDSSFITKKHLLDAIGEIDLETGAVNIDDSTLVGGNTFDNPIKVNVDIVAMKSDLTRDSIGRVAGRDSIDFYRDGVKITTIKDSTGGAGTGDNWGTQKVVADEWHSGGGVIGDTLRLQKQKVKDSVLSWVPNAPLPPFNNSSTINVTGNTTIGYTWNCSNCGVGGGNVRQAYSALDFGAFGDAIIPGSGSVPTSGTDNTTAMNRIYNEVPSGSVVYWPGGGRKYWFKTVPDTLKNNKTFYFIFDGDVYNINTSGQGIDFIIVKNGSGTFEQSRFEFRGNCYGKINMPSHTKTTHDNGTGPNWSTFTGTLVKLINVNQQWVEINKAEGYQQPVNIMGGYGEGPQENTVIIRWSYKNANAFTQSSIDGNSYNDKNHIWISRASGGLGLKIDGYAPAAAVNGENYNGSFNFNDYHIMIEQCDSAIEALGDVREPIFDIMVEAGTTKNVFGSIGFRMRSTSPNYVRDPTYIGAGFLELAWMQNGMGLNARGTHPVWVSSTGRRYANKWKTDGSGNLIMIGSTLTKAQRDAAYTSLLYAPDNEQVVYKTITASTYTAAPGEVIQYNNASGTLTAPSASANVGRRFTVQNIHGSNALTISGVANYTSVPAGDNMTWESNGTDWRGTVNAEGTGGGSGDSTFTADAQGRTTSHKLGFRTASVSGGATAFPGSTTSVAAAVFKNGVMPTTPVDGAFVRVDGHLYFTNNSTTKEILTIPDNGSARQVVMRNAANDDYEHKYVDKMYYSNTSTITSSGASSASKTSITGGTVTLDPLNSGDVIIMEGEGEIYTGATASPTPTFDYVLNSTANIFNTAVLSSNSSFVYSYRIKIIAGGGSSVELKISLNGSSAPHVVYFSSATSTGLNLSAPTVNVRSWFTNSGHLMYQNTSTVEIKRK